jgi:hypothetical protein
MNRYYLEVRYQVTRSKLLSGRLNSLRRSPRDRAYFRFSRQRSFVKVHAADGTAMCTAAARYPV